MSRFPSEAIRLLNGFRGYQLVVTACRLRLPDMLAVAPAGAEELAARAGMDPDAMLRFLRGLAAWGFFAEDEDGRYAATAVSESFRSDRPGLRNMALMLNEEAYPVWSELMYSLKTGKPAFDHLYGKSRWEKMAEDAEDAARFNAAMVEGSRRVGRELVEAYDFSDAKTVVDVGGGNGALLARVLGAHRHLRGTLFDLPSGLAGAAAALEAEGLSDRVELVEGSFFEKVPDGADVYLLKSIVHDWDHESALRILRTCRAAMTPASRLLLVERLVPERITDGDVELSTVMSDLHMMVLLGGRERTTSEYAYLLESAGLRLERTVAMPSEFYVVEALTA